MDVFYNLCGLFVLGMLAGWYFVEAIKGLGIFLANIERRTRK